MLILFNELHEPVRFGVRICDNSPEKSRAFLIKLFGRGILGEQIDYPIFSLGKIINLWVATKPISTTTDTLLFLFSVRICDSSPAKSRKFRALPSEEVTLGEQIDSPIFLFDLNRPQSDNFASRSRHSSPQTCIKQG